MKRTAREGLTRMSLRRQFVAAFVTFSVVVAVAGGWLAWRLTSGALEREMDDKLQAVAGAFAGAGLQANIVLSLEPGDERQEISLWRPTYEKLLRLQAWVSEAYVFRRDNTALVTTEAPGVLPIGTRIRWLDAYEDELARAWTDGHATTPLFEGEDGRLYKYGFVRIENSEAMMAVLIQANFLEPLNRFRRALLFGGALAIFGAIALAAVLAKNVARPLERLSRVALRIQRGRMGEPVAPERGYELRRLSRAMERMRRGIIQRDEQLRLMLAQVAHEIRNPLGGLELFATAAAESEEPEERRRLLARVRGEVSDLNQIIDDFLAFARPMRPGPELHDIGTPVQEAAELVSMELAKRGGRMGVMLPPEPLLARADPEHVKRIVLNLVRNAAEAGDHVQVEAFWQNGEAVIAIRDDGPGVPAELRERIFEPFVSQKEKGAGLGLAIVRRVARANGGRVVLARSDDTPVGWGAEFRVYFTGSDELPVVEPASVVGADSALS